MIGIFDSGHGGLTVLSALRHHLPSQAFCYLGDHAAAPYGERSPQEIQTLTKAGIECLFNQGCRLVVLACNTASALTLRTLQQTWLPGRAPDRRVLGVLVPAVEEITQQPWQKISRLAKPVKPPRRIAVFATRRTVESRAYPQEIALRSPEITVLQRACPGLAGKIEEGANRDELWAMVEGEVEALLSGQGGERLDLAVLACTHYPLVADAFKKALPLGTELLDQPRVVARSLGAYLRRHPDLIDTAMGGRVRCFTSGDPVLVNRKAAAFTGRDWSFESLPEYSLHRDSA